MMLICIHVHDLVVIGSNIAKIEEFKGKMMRELCWNKGVSQVTY